MINSRDLLQHVETVGNKGAKKTNSGKLATITKISGNKIFVQFDGEDVPSGKPYSYLDSFKPIIGERAFGIKQSNTYLFIGQVK